MNCSSVGSTTICDFDGCTSFHVYFFSKPEEVISISALCVACTSPAPNFNSEVALLMLFFCSIRKVSVATRLPFTMMPKLPESTTVASPEALALLCVSAACETAVATATAARKKLMRVSRLNRRTRCAIFVSSMKRERERNTLLNYRVIARA